MVAAAHDSFTGNNLQEDWGDATDDSNAAPGKKHAGVANDKEIEAMPPPRKKRSASCDGEECEDDEDGKKRAAAIKLRRGENAEEGQTRIVTTTCQGLHFDPDEIVKKYIQGKRVPSRRLV